MIKNTVSIILSMIDELFKSIISLKKHNLPKPLKKYDILLYIHIVIIADELSKGRNKPVTYLGHWNILPDPECCYALILGRAVREKSLPWHYCWPLLSSLTT